MVRFKKRILIKKILIHQKGKFEGRVCISALFIYYSSKMIKPIEISPLNTAFKLFFICEYCKEQGTIELTNKVINTDNEENPLETLDYRCPNCGNLLNEERVTQEVTD